MGLGSGSRLRRMRRRLGLSRELWIQNLGNLGSGPMAGWESCPYVSTDGSARACGVGDCARLVPSLSGPRETSGPQIDRIPATRPPWRDRQYRELKKIIFLAPSKCPIDLFGPVANRTILKRLHAAVSPNLVCQYKFAVVAAKAEQRSQRASYIALAQTRCKSNNQEAFE
jgi:hypothetical protein